MKVDHALVAPVIEVCVEAARLDLALALVHKMEVELDLSPDRRIYSLMIRAFGERGDVASALGVFEEMRRSGCFVPDVRTLDGVLDICFRNPRDLRHICAVLEDMAEDASIDLEVYSKDILMQGFSDAFTLGRALMNMEVQPQMSLPSPDGKEAPAPALEVVRASFPVLAVLAQAARTRLLVPASAKATTTTPARRLEETLTAALAFLGSVGIHPDAGTMEYFRIPDLPVKGSPRSRHHVRLLEPHRHRVGSLMDLEVPAEIRQDLSAVESYAQAVRSRAAKRVEPYFEAGRDDWREHSRLVQLVAPREGPDGQVTLGEAAPLELDSARLFDIQSGEVLSLASLDEADYEDTQAAEDDTTAEERRILTSLSSSSSSLEASATMPLEVQETFLLQAKPSLSTPLSPSSASIDTPSPPSLGQGNSALPRVVYKVKGAARAKVLADQARNKKKARGARQSHGAVLKGAQATSKERVAQGRQGDAVMDRAT